MSKTNNKLISGSKDSRPETIHKQIQEREITPECIEQFSKVIVEGMVKVLTSKDGYEIMKELSKR